MSTQPAPPRPPEERGRLSIDPLVVRKVAQHAADTTEGTATARRTLAGMAIGTQRSSVRVTGEGNDIDLAIDLALHYPAAVRQVVDVLRARVSDEVERVTAYRVRGVDVTVSALLPDIPPRVE